MLSQLPKAVTQHLPYGYQPNPGLWLVLPEMDSSRDGIHTVNGWLRAEDWYPNSLQEIVWFGDDGVGNFLGWKQKTEQAVLWNPEDGKELWKEGTVEDLWKFILNGYV